MQEVKEMMHSKKRKGFTLIEILVIVAIIAILATVIMVSINESRRKARIVNTMTSSQSALPIIVSCNSNPKQQVAFPAEVESGITPICAKHSDSFWPKLLAGYTYVQNGNYEENCRFEISTNGDRATNIVCDCLKQSCQ